MEEAPATITDPYGDLPQDAACSERHGRRDQHGVPFHAGGGDAPLTFGPMKDGCVPSKKYPVQ